MSKNVAVFVDVANLYYSARGQEVDVDYVALLKAATKSRDLIRAYAYSGLDPENENQRKFIDFLNKNGYKVVHKDIRKFGDGRVKANLDIELVVDLFRLADRMDIAVIVSGDGDFAPAIRALQDKGVRCEVISFRPNTSSDLIAVADEFIDIMKIIGIGRGKDAEKADKTMSAPPMPAKEVVPEFGFREAPASVAAAALAALREGKDGKPTSGRGSRGGRGRTRAAAPAEEAPAAVAEVAESADEPRQPTSVAEGTAEGGERRRRRRRGGRGRGRGGRGRGESALTSVEGGAEGAIQASSTGEIGWVELDDISQIDDFEGVVGGDEAREYTFEEADAETLAELGIAPAAEAAAPKAPASKPRRTRTVKPATKADAEAESQAPAPRPRRSRATKPAPTAETPTAEASSSDAPASKPRRARAAKPAARPAAKPAAKAAGGTPAARSRRPRKAADGEEPAPDATADGQEGIWQRFRSGRKS